jgi:hypothetical protein
MSFNLNNPELTPGDRGEPTKPELGRLMELLWPTLRRVTATGGHMQFYGIKETRPLCERLLHDLGHPETTRTFLNHEETVLVTVWPNREVDVQTRGNANQEWSMPFRCREETDG